MPVPINTLFEVGMLALEEYKKFRDRGERNLTDDQWSALEAKIKARRLAAWTRFDDAQNP